MRRTTFQSNPKSLEDLLKEVRDGKIQLPDFQRGWVWDDDHIRALVASVSLNYPIGVVMALQTGDDEVRFRARPIEGAPETQNRPEFLLLDGQQRMTSLYQALYQDGPVTTRDARGRVMQRRYYIDICKALDPSAEREEAIVSVDASRVSKNFRGEIVEDYRTRAQECAAEMFPVPLLFNTVELTQWQMAYLQADGSTLSPERVVRWTRFTEEIIQRFQGYQVPVITLLKGTPKEAVCQVFERVNTGGVPLTVFELLTATYAADDFALRDDWKARHAALHPRYVLRHIGSTEFLQAVTLLSTHTSGHSGSVTCKRRDILSLPLSEYQSCAPLVVTGFERAARFLAQQGIFSPGDVPYRTQLVPLAAVLAELGEGWHSDSIRTRLAQWYWCGVFGELYGSTVETRFARDLQELLAWVNSSGPLPSTIQEAQFAESRLLRLRTRGSAAYKGIYAMLIREGGLDFRTGEPIQIGTFFDEHYDVHHIFPEHWCKAHRIEPAIYNAIANKTAISFKTNRSIGGLAPSKYLERLQKADDMDDERMDAILRSHLIDPSLLRADDFYGFLEARRKALAERIEQAMGKPVLRDVAQDTTSNDADDEDAAESEAGDAEVL